MITNFEELIPSGILFSIKQINDMGLIRSDLLKKLIYTQKIEVTKLNSKNFISRQALIAYLTKNTVKAIN
ncbi:DNA-binding protein [Aliarcobacter butzleri]|uniref:DNA-binding protein n=1 Tax=Aliarcobacter butzleri TaxID=28197 RepID=UPI002B246AC5|nr:DNA-binding protein [Aliarcobacter butzleri]